MRSSNFALIAAVLAGIALATPAASQTQFVGRDYFPAALEFRELQEIQSERTVDAPASLTRVEGGELIAEAGFQKYAQRIYKVPDGFLSIEVLTLNDAKAAYSLLTLFRSAVIKAGPPGDGASISDNSLLFVRGNYLVRLQGTAADLSRRVALSVSNRIGEREPADIPLVTRLATRDGYDPGSLRYFLGPRAFAAHGNPVAAGFEFKPDMEVTQAAFSAGGRQGTLTIVTFPTSQMSEEYFDSVGGTLGAAAGSGRALFSRRAGPMVGFLDGNFDPGTAERILGAVQYSYSVKWIYDSNRRGKIVWGIPMGVLGTVVRSLVFVAMLCGASILLGAGIALLRFYGRGRSGNHLTGHPEESQIIRLKIDEN